MKAADVDVVLAEKDAEIARLQSHIHEMEIIVPHSTILGLRAELEQAKAQLTIAVGTNVRLDHEWGIEKQRADRAEAACADGVKLLAIACRLLPQPLQNEIAEYLQRDNPGQRYLNLAKLVKALPKVGAQWIRTRAVDQPFLQHRLYLNGSAIPDFACTQIENAATLAALLAWRQKEQP